MTKEVVEETQRQSEERYRAIYEQVIIGITQVDLTGRFISANQRFCQIVGRSEEELLTRRMQEITHPDDLAHNIVLFQQMLTEGTSFEIEKRYIRPDGSHVWVRNYASLIKDAAGKPQRGVAVTEDITARKRAEQRQAAQYAVTRTLAEATNLASAVPAILQSLCSSLGWQLGVIWSVDRQTHTLHYVNCWYAPAVNAQEFIEANQQTTFAHGVALPGRVWETQQPLWLSELSDDNHFERATAAAKGGLHAGFGFPIQLGDEILGVIECFSNRIQEPDEDLLQMMAAIGSQIGQFMERKRTEEALLESQALFQSFMNHSPATAFIKDEAGRFLYVNRLIEQAFNRPSADWIGKTDFDLFPTEAAQQWRENDLTVLETRQTLQLLETAPQEDGEHYYMSFKFPLQDVAGRCLVAGMSIDVTERIRAEKALQESEQRLKLAQLAANAGTWDWEIATNSVNWSEEYYRLYGLDPATIPSYENWLASVIEEDRERVDREVREALEHRTNINFECRTLHPTGELRWLNVIGQTIYNTEGNPERMVGIVLDITDRKQAEVERERLLRELDAERARFEAVLRQMPAGVIIAEAPSGKLILGNEQVQRIWRHPFLPSSDVEQYREYKGFHPDGRPYIPEEWPLARSLLTGEVVNGEEIQFLRGDGTYGTMQVSSTPIRNPDGDIVAGVVVFDDITDRKQVEEALRQSELSFRTLADTMPQLFWTTRPDGYHEYFNQRWYEYTGMTLEQTQGWGWNPLLHPDDRQRALDIWKESLRTGKEYNIEYRFRRASDGQYRWFLGRAFPLRDEEGRIVRWFGSCTDIHDQKCALEERDRALEQEQAARQDAERANRIKDEFLAVLSHELRSPLNPILGWAKLLQTRQFDEGTTKRAIETIERNAKLQSELIEDLLDVSRILQGKMVLNVCPVNLVSVIEAALETVRLAAQAKGIEIQKVLALDVGQVSGDSARLQQVVWNLLSNAVKFTPSGGRVEVRLERDGDYAQIQVKDTGKGIAREFLPHVFDYFRQEDGATTRKFGGLGLGLAIVRHLTELHGGTVGAESLGEGLGATFTAKLPLMAIAPQTTQEDKSSVETFNLNQLQILVVDDEADMRELALTILEDYGAKVRVAASAMEAFTMLDQFKIDVLICDIGMPQVDGYMFMRQVRQRSPQAGGEIRAIALTAYASEVNQQQALAAGFQKHVAKPVEPNKLVEVIATVVKDYDSRLAAKGWQ
ncbi:PAS domain S-box protein [Microcoleus sp. ZQ-A2]|nr:PAS domain S-box protein [Microcoleus sp. FACHB-1]